MANNLLLSFTTSDGKVCNLNVKNPRADITRAEAVAVMEDIIAKNVFETASGATLTAVAGVYSVVTNKTELLI